MPVVLAKRRATPHLICPLRQQRGDRVVKAVNYQQQCCPIAPPEVEERRLLLVGQSFDALRNALLPIVNVLGMGFSILLGANVLVEQVFAWPGVGAYAVNAVIASDYAAVQGFVLTMAVIYVLLNLAVDVVVAALDPRVRLGV